MLEIGQSAGKLKSYAYILGTYLGDGCAYHDTHNRSYLYILNTIDEDFADRVFNELENLLNKKPRRYLRPAKGNRKPVHRVEVNSKELYAKLRNDTFDKMLLPPEAFNWPEDARKNLIIGAFDSDGWVSKSSLASGVSVYQLGIAKSKLYIKEMPKLLKSVGVACGKPNRMKQSREDGASLIRILVNKRSWVDAGMKFTAKRKQDRMNEYVTATSETICRAHYAKI